MIVIVIVSDSDSESDSDDSHLERDRSGAVQLCNFAVGLENYLIPPPPHFELQHSTRKLEFASIMGNE